MKSIFDLAKVNDWVEFEKLTVRFTQTESPVEGSGDKPSPQPDTEITFAGEGGEVVEIIGGDTGPVSTGAPLPGVLAALLLAGGGDGRRGGGEFFRHRLLRPGHQQARDRREDPRSVARVAPFPDELRTGDWPSRWFGLGYRKLSVADLYLPRTEIVPNSQDLLPFLHGVCNLTRRKLGL